MSFARSVFAFVILSAVGLAADKTSPLAIYEQFPQAARPHLRKAYQEEVKRRTKVVGLTKSAISKAKVGDARDAAQAAHDEAKQSLDDLKKNDPPFVGNDISDCRGETVVFEKEEIKIGDFGLMVSEHKQVLQVTGKDSALLLNKISGGGRQTIMVQGVDTTGWIDGDGTYVTVPVFVSGTTTYQTANGSTNTCFKAERFDWDTYRKSLKKK